MNRRVGEWCHHAQVLWCSAYGSQCVWFSASKMDLCRFKWSSGYHSTWYLLQWNLCTSCKDVLHKARFSHCSFEVVGGTSHGCEECLLRWWYERINIYAASITFVTNIYLVFRLKKSLYGLKQAPRAWYANIDGFLISPNYCRCKSDPNFYLKMIHGSLIIILLYVYELFIIGSSKK